MCAGGLRLGRCVRRVSEALPSRRTGPCATLATHYGGGRQGGRRNGRGRGVRGVTGRRQRVSCARCPLAKCGSEGQRGARRREHQGVGGTVLLEMMQGSVVINIESGGGERYTCRKA
jgi:hypothetical protein